MHISKHYLIHWKYIQVYHFMAWALRDWQFYFLSLGTLAFGVQTYHIRRLTTLLEKTYGEALVLRGEGKAPSLAQSSSHSC